MGRISSKKRKKTVFVSFASQKGGVGKTTTAMTFAKVLGLDTKRVQFTSDTVPSDIIGYSVYDKESGSFWRIDWDHIPVHYPGTGDIFTSVLTASLLKGESLPIALNRATTFTEIAVKTTYSYGTEPRLGVLFEDCLSWLMTNTVLCDYRKL